MRGALSNERPYRDTNLPGLVSINALVLSDRGNFRVVASRKLWWLSVAADRIARRDSVVSCKEFGKSADWLLTGWNNDLVRVYQGSVVKVTPLS